MYLFISLGLVTLVTVSGQQHGHGGALHGICHSNHLQLTEDQVIQNVVSAMNTDPDGTIEMPEILVFFADLVGVQLGMSADLLDNLTNTELLQVAGGLRLSKDQLVRAWHSRFHDSMEFIRATFDAFDINGDGVWDAVEIEGIVNAALRVDDPDNDNELQEEELVNFLERIYKNC